MIDGVVVTRPKRIVDHRGSVMRMLRTDDPHFIKFAEIYFSTVNPGQIKGWKRHNEMTMNIAVPAGRLHFVLYDDRPGSPTKGEVQEFDLGPHDYQLLTVPPGLWSGFRAVGNEPAFLANCPTILHRPEEADDLPPDDPSIPHRWEIEPEVSVLMSVYNGADYLRPAIDSILNQTFAKFELIVVDNASTDGTAEILESYHDPRLVRLRNDSLVPIPVSLNRGLSVVKAPLIARLDADDVAHPERLARQFAVMSADPALVLLGTWWDDLEEGRVTPGPETPTRHQDLLDALAGGNPIAHSSVMMRRAAVEAAGGYDEQCPYAQDYALWLALAREHRIAILPDRLVQIRLHAAQLSVVPSWSAIRLEDAIRLHEIGLTLPGLGVEGLRNGCRALAAACYRLSVLRLKEGRTADAAKLILRGLNIAPLATLTHGLAWLRRRLLKQSR